MMAEQMDANALESGFSADRTHYFESRDKLHDYLCNSLFLLSVFVGNNP